MNLVFFQLVCVIVATLFVSGSILACSRKPQGAAGDRSPVDDNFQVHIEGNPTTYIQGQLYNISLSCASGLKFTSFTLALDSDDGNLAPDYDLLGHFEIINMAETRFSTHCENMIENTNANAKTRVDVAWVAPTNPKSGCIFIRAAVLQHRNVWFIDDGFLSKRICPEETDEINSQTKPVNPCCACDEAKYEIILERRWTRNTHAKDFPQELWRTRFSEVIGASHFAEYRFWDYGQPASPGLQELAEHGSTSTLETEIKSGTNSDSIRTIVRAPGIPYRRNIAGTTLATVRVDRMHHVVSLVSKIVPSPDWIVGVAGLELCLANCTWVYQKVLNLYPWDIGTDAGPSYMSPDQPQRPPDVIRRITSTFPSDLRSPFYDKSGAPMKPVALLYISRKKLYERECIEPLECTTLPWTSWSECSSKCGAGVQYRTRAYRDRRLAESYGCQLLLRQNKRCSGECGPSELEKDPSAAGFSSSECELNADVRDFPYPYARDKCQNGRLKNLEESQNCSGGGDCDGTISSEIEQKQNQHQIGDIDDYVVGGNRAQYGPEVTGPEIYGAEYYVDPRNGQPGKYEQFDGRLQVASVDGNNYSIVQQYCFVKPQSLRNPCGRNSKIRNFWFYDADDYKCKIFTANGCYESRNKFRTLSACEGTCLLPHLNQKSLNALNYDDDVSKGLGGGGGGAASSRSNGSQWEFGYNNFNTPEDQIQINGRSKPWRV